MFTWDEFSAEIHKALLHLYDPDYQPSEHLCTVICSNPQAGAGTVQVAIIQAIEELKPPVGPDTDSKAGRVYATLHHRFVLGQTQEETAEQLELSVRHLGRVQREAIHHLARRFWEAHLAQQKARTFPLSVPDEPSADISTAREQIPDWRTQVKGDLASLRSTAPGATADLDEVIQETIALESVLSSERGVTLVTESPHPTLTAAIHPSVLRQILIMTVGWLVQNATVGEITLRSVVENQYIRITLSSWVSPSHAAPDISLQREILAQYDGTIRTIDSGDYLQFQIDLPSAGDITVLVVDDNPDMIYFYQRCTDGTKYHIVPESRGSLIFEAVETHTPQIIVLDIMLPDIDGWQLLARLHQHPATREIPIIACSVIREKDLALALGATLYLSKPLSHRQFRQALDQALSQGAAASQVNQGSSAVID